MPSVKFSDFPIDAFANGYLVGLNGSNANIKVDKTSLANSLSPLINIDLVNQVYDVLSIANGGTNASNADDALTNITSANTRIINTILQFTGTGWAISNPTENNNIPITAFYSAEWQGFNPFYSFTPYSFNVIPYDYTNLVYTSYPFNTFIPTMNYNSATDTSFTFGAGTYGYTYKIEVFSYLTNQGNGNFVEIYLLDSANNPIQTLSSDHNVGSPVNKTYYGYCLFTPNLNADTIKVGVFPQNVCTGYNVALGGCKITISLLKSHL